MYITRIASSVGTLTGMEFGEVNYQNVLSLIASGKASPPPGYSPQRFAAVVVSVYRAWQAGNEIV